MQFIENLFDTKDFPARWHCGTWSETHGWVHIISDIAIFAAYTAIPIVLVYFILKRKDLMFPKVLWLFVLFIFACGTGHLLEATIFWHPWYRLTGSLKLITAIVSWLTVFALIRITPKILVFPSLAISNEKMKSEIELRKSVESKLRENSKILDEANQELGQINEVMLGREKRIIELKEEVNQLLIERGEEVKFKSVEIAE